MKSMQVFHSQPLMLVIVSCALVILSLFPSRSDAITDTSKIPILLYHSAEYPQSGPCTYYNTPSIGLQEDLNSLHLFGYTVVPVSWIVEWAAGRMSSSALPNRVVGITFDDGKDLDWFDKTNHPTCGTIKSFGSSLNSL